MSDNKTKDSKRNFSEVTRVTRSRSRSESEESKVSQESKTKSSNNSPKSFDKKKRVEKLNLKNQPSNSNLNNINNNVHSHSDEESTKSKNSPNSHSFDSQNSANNIKNINSIVSKNLSKSLSSINKEVILEENSETEEEGEENTEPEYEVEAIVGKKTVRGKLLYQVKWKGYPSEDNTWEPLKNLTNVIDIVEQFDEMDKIFKKRQTSEKASDNITKYLKESGLDSILRNSTQSKSKNNLPGVAVNLNSQIVSSQIENKNPLTRNSFSQTEIIEQKNSDSVNNSSSLPPLNPYDSRLKAVKVIHAYCNSKQQMTFLMQWERNLDGIRPKDSWISHEEVKKHFPYLLLEYYERKIRIITNSNSHL